MALGFYGWRSNYGIPTPELGISETIGNLFNKPTTSQGGSNIFGGGSTPQSAAYSTPTFSQGSTEPVYVTGGPGGAYPQAPQGGVNGGGGGGDGGSGQPSGPSMEDMLNQGYSDYFSYLDQLEGGLPGQRATQEEIVGNQYNTGVNNLTNTFTQNKKTLEETQAKNLGDLSDYLRQAWQQGNSLLGTRGASDSSAANQYSYALSKVASQNRGSLMQDFNSRVQNLQGTYDTEKSNLEMDKNNKLLQVSQWFADAQNQIRGMRADAQRSKSQEALNYAMNMANQIAQENANRRAALDSWVLNKSNSLQEAVSGLNANTQNMPALGQFNASMQGYSPMNNTGMFGYGNKDKDQYGNILL